MEDNDDDESEEGGAGVGVDGDGTNVSAQDSSIDGHDTVDEGDNSCSGTDDEYSYVYELSSDENEESAATTRDPAPSFASAAAAAAANKGKGARILSLFVKGIDVSLHLLVVDHLNRIKFLIYRKNRHQSPRRA